MQSCRYNNNNNKSLDGSVIMCGRAKNMIRVYRYVGPAKKIRTRKKKQNSRRTVFVRCAYTPWRGMRKIALLHTIIRGNVYACQSNRAEFPFWATWRSDENAGTRDEKVKASRQIDHVAISNAKSWTTPCRVRI